MMSFSFPENPEYEFSVYARTPYLDDDVLGGYFGALEYVGEYAIVTGYNGEACEVEGEYATMILRVGKKSVAEAMDSPHWKEKVLSAYGSDSVVYIRDMHMMAKASCTDLMNI
jgi:hypothetical protein